MPMLRRIFLLVSTLALLTLSASAQNKPGSVVEAFYKFDRANSQTVDRQSVDARKQFFSAELYRLWMHELDRQAEFLKANPTEKPYFGDGFPFRPFTEPCEADGKSYTDSYKVGKAAVKGGLASVDVRFFYPPQCRIPEVVHSVRLIIDNDRWTIDNIVFTNENTSLAADLKRDPY